MIVIMSLPFSGFIAGWLCSNLKCSSNSCILFLAFSPDGLLVLDILRPDTSLMSFHANFGFFCMCAELISEILLLM